MIWLLLRPTREPPPPGLGSLAWCSQHAFLVAAVFGVVAIVISYKIAKKLSKTVFQVALAVAVLVGALYFGLIKF